MISCLALRLRARMWSRSEILLAASLVSALESSGGLSTSVLILVENGFAFEPKLAAGLQDLDF